MFKNLTYKLSLLLLILFSVGATAMLPAYDGEEGDVDEDQGYTEDAQGYSEDAQGYSEDAQGYPEDAQGYPEDAQGYTEEYDEEQVEAFDESSAPAEEQYSGELEEKYVEEVYVEEEQGNNQAPVWEGPIPFEPAYSGKENIRIERSTRLKAKNQAERSSGSSETAEGAVQQAKEKQATVFQKACDPVVRVSANREKPFDVLKPLADEHGFEIMMLEAENQPISLEKHDLLSRVIESITRDMSVVLNYQKANGCERLVAISVLDNSEWSGAGRSHLGTSKSGNAAANLRQYKPVANSLSSPRNTESDTNNSSPASYNTPAYQSPEAKKQELEDLREQRRKARKQRALSEESGNGKRFENDAYGNDSREGQSEQIDNMEVYVDEVMSGKRVPNIRAMTIQERTEYMRLRREHKQQKQQ